MLRIITGRSSSGKSEEMFKLLGKTENAIYIVPEQYSFAAEKKIAHRFGMSGMGKPCVYSFRRLAYYFEELYGSDCTESLSGVGRVMVLSDIVKRNADKLTLFGGAARRGEMANEAAVIVTTFKEYNVTLDKIEKAIENSENPLLKKKLSDCAVICGEYERFLESGYSDEEDLLSELCTSIASNPYLDGKDIFIDSFYAFTPMEYSVIEEMLKKAASVTVALCAFGDGDEFVTSKRTMERLIKLCRDINVPFGGVIEKTGAMYTAADEMKALENSFFDENEVFDKKTDRICVHRARDEYGEAVRAAREVEYLVREKGCRYRDIVIVARDIEPYEKHLERAFDRFDIPLFTDKKTPLSLEAAAVFALSAIKCISYGWRREDIFGYMKSIFSPIDTVAACEVENYVLASGVRAKDWKSDEKWSMPSSVKDGECDEEYLKRINEARMKVAAPLIELEDKIKGKRSGRELCVAFYEFLEECALEEKMMSIADKLEEIGQGEQAMRTRQVYDMLIGILECFDDAFEKKEMTGKEFFEIISKGIESVEIGVIPSSTDSVCVGSIDRARGHDADYAIIIGCIEGVFPATVQESGIFTNADRQELLSYNIELPPDTIGKAYMEESLVYGALTCARESLFVSYSTPREGMGASSIIRRIKKVFPNCIVTDELNCDDALMKIGNAKSTYEDFAREYASYINGDDVGDEWLTVIDYYKNSDEWKDKVKEIERHMSYENRSELIRREIIEARYGGEIKSSVSRLERYAQCPFSYFAEVTLGLKERKELEVTRADAGVFLHEFVDLFGKGIRDDNTTWRDIDSEYIDKKTEEITLGLIKGLNRHLLENSPAVRSLFVRLKRIAKRSVTALCEHMKKGSFEPLGYEIKFDNDGEFKPVTIDLPNGQRAVLRGRVDRADILDSDRGKFVRIIDYKSGEKKFSIGNIYHGFDLQLAMYLTAVCEGGGYRPAGMLYFKIDDPVIDMRDDLDDEGIEREVIKKLKMDGLVLEDDEILNAMDKFYASGSSVIPVKRTKDGGFDAYSKVATEGEFAAISKHAKATVRRLCNEILQGRSDISPVRGACSYCKMKDVCGFDMSISGCSYRRVDKLNDKEALLKIIEEEEAVTKCTDHSKT